LCTRVRDISIFHVNYSGTNWCQCLKAFSTAQFCRWSIYQIFRIGTARYAESLWRMRRHGPVIADCTDSEDFPSDISTIV